MHIFTRRSQLFFLIVFVLFLLSIGELWQDTTRQNHVERLRRVASHSDISWALGHALFFVHIPKTAGQSFTRMMHKLSEPYQLYYHRKRTGSRRIDLTFMATKHVLQHLYPTKRANFTQLWGKDFSSVGHTDVLIERAFQADHRQVEFITMLRHPVKRVFSHYCYMLRGQHAANKHQQHSLIYPSWSNYQERMHNEISTESFIEYVTLAILDQMDNWHTRAFSGCLHTIVVAEDDQPKFCNDNHAMLAEAKRRLQGFLFVGLTEKYNESIDQLKYVLRYNPSIYNYSNEVRKNGAQVLNINTEKDNCMKIITKNGTWTENLERTVANVESLDIELYAFAEELFDKRRQMMRIEQKITKQNVIHQQGHE